MTTQTTSGGTAKPTVFIDGEAGTTGLEIRDRLARLGSVDVLSIDPDMRKDRVERQALMDKADLIVLCLPDYAARDAVDLAAELGRGAPKIVDASTAHRVAHGWVYGFAELAAGQSQAIADAPHVANPGCYPTGAIALLRPLIDAGLIARDHAITVNAVSGYSGGGRQMIEAYETGDAPAFELYSLGLEHKHVPELQHYAGLTRRPLFVPSVGRFKQGMLVSIPLHLDDLPGAPALRDLETALLQHYAKDSCIKVIAVSDDSAATATALKLSAEDLNGTDLLELRVYGNEKLRQGVLVARLDNLGKGAAGAAVQNIQLMLGL